MPETTFGLAKIKAVGDLMRDDERVVVIGGAGFGGLLHSKFVQPLFDEFDDRILRTPIAELGFCGMGIGAAIAGLYPIVTIGTGSFAFEAWPQIVNEAPNIFYMSGGQVKVPVMFHALVGIRLMGAAQHSARPQAMLMQAAGLQIIAPARASDVLPLLQAAKDSERPTFWIDHPLLFEEKGRYEAGKASSARQGRRRAQRQGCDPRRLFHRPGALSQGGGATCKRRHRCRSHRSSDARALRQGHHSGVGRKDRPAGGGRRVLSSRKRGVGGREPFRR